MPPRAPSPPRPSGLDRPPPLPVLGYGAMRLRWCRRALRVFVARWGVYGLVAALAFSAGTTSAVDIVLSASAALVLPLMRAAAWGAWGWLALPAQALLGAALMWGARHLLWPPHWAEAERALPIATAATRRSDAQVAALALLPLGALYALGTVSTLGHHPPWMAGHALAATLAPGLAWVGSLGLGVWGLQRARRWPAQRRSAAWLPRTDAAPRRPSGASVPSVHWVRALVLSPLWRGPARRTGRTLVGGGLLLLTPSGGLMAVPAGGGWWLALASALALLVCTRVNHLARLDFAELHAAAASLPLRPQGLRRWRQSLGLWPVLPALGLLAGLALHQADPTQRNAVLLAWLLACVAAAGAEVQAEPAEPGAKAGRWLFSLALSLCLASEVRT